MGNKNTDFIELTVCIEKKKCASLEVFVSDAVRGFCTVRKMTLDDIIILFLCHSEKKNDYCAKRMPRQYCRYLTRKR